MIAHPINTLIVDSCFDSITEEGWEMMSASVSLSDSVIVKYQDKLNIKQVIRVKELSVDMLSMLSEHLDYYDYLHIVFAYDMSEDLAMFLSWMIPESKNMILLRVIACNKLLSEEFIDEFADEINWRVLTAHGHVDSTERILKYTQRIDWEQLCIRKEFSNEELVMFGGYIRWDTVITNQVLSIEIVHYLDSMNLLNWIEWSNVVKFQTIPEDVLEFRIDSLYMSDVCKYQKLSCKFMDKHSENLDWEQVSNHQRFDIGFYRKYRNNLIDCQNVYDNEQRWKNLAMIDTIISDSSLLAINAPFEKSIWSIVDEFYSIEKDA